MALVFRSERTTPLTNDEVDNNFRYLRDQIATKYNTADLTAANISLKLRTTGEDQTALQLAQANALNAWTIRNLVPSAQVPVTTDKSSLVSRNENGDIWVSTVNGNLVGNADTATLADSAVVLSNARTINGVSFDGSQNITIVDSTKLALSGGTLTGKLNTVPASALTASLNLGTSSIAPQSSNKANGDVWATTSGLFFHIQGQTNQVAVLASPTFEGIPRAPGYDNTPSQVITLSHLDNAITSLNTSIATKADLASPTFTGNPRAPTPTMATVDTSIATTEYVGTAITSNTSAITTAYEASISTSIAAYSNTVNTLLAAKANLASPQFTGVPIAPTAAAGTNNTQIATTAFTTGAVSTVQNALNAAIVALQDAIAATRPIPVGAVFYMSYSTVPYGYLEANGQAVSRTTYAALWEYLGSPNTGNGSTTFNVPDLRGEFVRGWDHGRGVDTNRQLGSVQYSQNLEHNHGMPGDDQLTFANGAGGWSNTSRASFPYDARSSYGGGGQIWNTTTDGGGESRPRNVALMPVIKW